MKSHKHLIPIGSILSLLLLWLTLALPRHALGQMTIPTRTPVPDSRHPTAQPTDDNGGSGSDKPRVTAESAPTAETPPSATTMPTVAAAFATPLTQAGPCGLPPTFTAANTTSIYAGPGTNYTRIGSLGAAEIRPVIGRAASNGWWHIQLDPVGLAGWVSDESGIVHGNTAGVPVVAAPGSISADSTAAGAAWPPTPDPRCYTPQTMSVQIVWLPNPFFPIIAFQTAKTGYERRFLLAELTFEMPVGSENN